MPNRAREKKSESLEVRVAYSQKESFMDACRSNGDSASNVIRSFLDSYTNPENKKGDRRSIVTRVFAPIGIVVTAVVLVSFAFVSLTFSESNTAELFTQLDTNRDGLLSPNDLTESNAKVLVSLIELSDENADSVVTPQEFSKVKFLDAEKALGSEGDQMAALEDGKFYTIKVHAGSE